MKRSLQALCTLAVFAAPAGCKVAVSTNSAEQADAAKPDGEAPAATDATAEAEPETEPQAETPAPGAPTDLTAKPRAGETVEAAAPGGTTLAGSPSNECTDGTRGAGDTWKDDCNSCRCKDGTPMCTRMKCNPPDSTAK